jgi:hypothetical protein
MAPVHDGPEMHGRLTCPTPNKLAEIGIQKIKFAVNLDALALANTIRTARKPAGGLLVHAATGVPGNVDKRVMDVLGKRIGQFGLRLHWLAPQWGAGHLQNGKVPSRQKGKSPHPG